jgi:5-methylcytosine-specific restriction endonuclease McrA
MSDMGKLRKEILAKTGGRCAYCGKELNNKAWHLDHAISISSIGSIGWRRSYSDKENLLPSCPRCNLRKGLHSLKGFRTHTKKRLLKKFQSSEVETDIEELLQYLDVEDQEKVLNAYHALLLVINEANVVFLIDKLGKNDGE